MVNLGFHPHISNNSFSVNLSTTENYAFTSKGRNYSSANSQNIFHG